MAEIQYVDGNVHNAVIVHGDDPANEGNVIVTQLPTSVSVPKENITEVNETPKDEAAEAEKESQLRKDYESLKAKFEGDDSGNGS